MDPLARRGERTLATGVLRTPYPEMRHAEELIGGEVYPLAPPMRGDLVHGGLREHLSKMLLPCLRLLFRGHPDSMHADPPSMWGTATFNSRPIANKCQSLWYNLEAKIYPLRNMEKYKIIIFPEKNEEIHELTKNYGFILVEENPDFVISFGGDGTVMQSEAKYPCIPKIILKNSRICKLCSSIENKEVLEKVKLGKYTIENHPKLVAKAKGKELVAMNDITVHNGDPRSAIRYKFAINGKWTAHEIIGDGVVLATPLGSTGYYRSITDSFFEIGIGLAFNNSTEQSDHMVLKDDSKIDIEITRGPATVFADNINDNITLQLGDVVRLEKSKDSTRIVRVI